MADNKFTSRLSSDYASERKALERAYAILLPGIDWSTAWSAAALMDMDVDDYALLCIVHARGLVPPGPYRTPRLSSLTKQ